MKYALCSLAGSMFSAGAVVLAGGRPAVTLWLGFTLAMLTIGALLWLAGLRRVARFLDGFMDGLERAGAACKPALARASLEAVKPIGYVKPSSKQRDRILADTISEYLDDDTFSPPQVRRAS